MGVNPSNRRLRASNNLTKYGSGGHRLTGGGFGLGNKGGIGFGIMRFRLFHKIKPKSKTNIGLYDKNLYRFPAFRRVDCCANRLLQPINNQPKNNNSLIYRAGINRR